MKKNIYPIIALLALCFCMLSACTDDLAGGWTASDGAVSMKITLNLPASSSAQTRAAADELEAERRMDVEGMHLLVFENDILKEDIKEKQLGAEVDGKRTLTAKSAETYKKEIDVVVLANMNKNDIVFNSNNYIGKSKKELYEALKYAYGTEAWDVVGNEEYIPMWGAFTLTPSSGDNNVNVSLYRAVSKINVLVGKGAGLSNFTLTSVRVYYANQQGYAAPFVEPTGTDAVTSPSIGDGITQSDVKFPLLYEETKGTVALENRIYLPESNNKELADGKKPLCLVVGGKYEGAGLVENGKESFYRIDFKDKDGVYDALRNHLYIFDINSVSSPGTTTPEEALDKAVVGMKVTIESWNDTYMNGLTSQYSLVTDKSRASFDQKGGDITITVSSDYTEPWTVEDVEGEWFKHDVSGNKIILTTTANYGASRIGSFCIQAGQLKKQIFVDQAQPGTANCYLVGTGVHEMSVVVKGNGTSGLTAESKGGGTVKLEESATLEPAYLSVIWETEEGLITLIDAKTRTAGVKKANYDKDTGILKYNVKSSPIANDDLTGGNALIGAFNEKDEVIWSWHIWVCPEMVKSNNNNDETWGLTGYKVMDRNLGALSNQPGVGSLGLLYQWGRKDPFIGAAEISNNSPVMKTENYLSHTWGVDSTKNTIEFAIKNPTKLINKGLSVVESKKGAFLWGTDGGLAAVGIKDLGKKTIYDPCPIGYRVPPVDAFVFKGTTKYRPFVYETKPYAASLNPDDVIEWPFGKGSAHFSIAGTDHTVYGPMWISVARVDSGKEFFLNEGETFKIVKGEPNSVTPYKELAILKKSSETRNWDENLVYIPNNLSVKSTLVWNKEDYLYQPNDYGIEGADHYGFYMNYNKVSVPKMKDPGKDLYALDDNQPNITWLPLSGAYDPTKGFGFSGVTIEKGSSLTVNSFIWTNSSVESTDKIVRPAALFLHGAKPDNLIDGRHIHALNKKDIKAEPHYAGAVRCVRDEKKDFAEENKVPEKISFGSGSGASTESTIYAINENWRVIDPGAPWVRITPDRGVADKGRGTEVTFTAADALPAGSTSRTTVMKIQIGDKVHEVPIEQKAN